MSLAQAGFASAAAVALAVALLWLVLRRRRPPQLFALAEIEPDAVAAEIVRQLDEGPWKLRSEKEGVRVYSCAALPSEYVGFRTVTEHAASLETLYRYLGADLLNAFEEMNDRYVEGKELRVLSPQLRVVRTSFSMPPGFAGREFVHLLYETQTDERTRVIAYHSVDDEDLPAVQEGYVRCPIFPSGQRLTQLDDGRVRVEHLMVYDLAGRISRAAQNTLFVAGHVQAYHQEWRKLVLRMAKVQ